MNIIKALNKIWYKIWYDKDDEKCPFCHKSLRYATNHICPHCGAGLSCLYEG